MVTYNTIPKPSVEHSPYINTVNGIISGYPYVINFFPQVPVYFTMLSVAVFPWDIKYNPWLTVSLPWLMSGYNLVSKPSVPSYISIPKPS